MTTSLKITAGIVFLLIVPIVIYYFIYESVWFIERNLYGISTTIGTTIIALEMIAAYWFIFDGRMLTLRRSVIYFIVFLGIWFAAEAWVYSKDSSSPLPSDPELPLKNPAS